MILVGLSDPLSRSMDFWRGPENITLHCVDSNNDTWPSPVQDLARLLTLSLPHWVHDGPYPFISKDAKYLSSELCNLRCMLSSTYDSVPSDAPTLDGRLARAFDTALSVTAILRTILSAESKSPHEGSTKVAFLATLVRNVTLFCLPDAWVWEGASFVLPRHPRSLSNPIARYTRTTSTAPLIICCAVDGFQELLTRSQSTNCKSELDGAAIRSASSQSHSSLESEPRRYTMEDFALGYPRTESSDISEGSGDADSVTPVKELLHDSHTEETYDPILGAHMLASASSSDTPAIPIVCMADSDEIYGLMASALYQRRVWRIYEPVVGLTFSRLAAGIQIIFGWLEDDETSDPNLLPTVHIAYGCGALCSGAFNICDPVSTLRLCSFLLSLDNHFNRIWTAISESLARVTDEVVNGEALIWRSDFQSINSDDCDYLVADKQIISDWAGQVAIALGPREIPVMQEGEMSSETNIVAQSKVMQRDGHPKSMSATHAPLDILSETARTCARTRRYSCSEFAAGVGQDKNELTLKWLSDRLAVATSFPILNEHDSELDEQGSLLDEEDSSIKTITELYDEYTSYRWPKAWVKLSDLPGVDPELEPLREELFAANGVENTHAEFGRTTPSKDVPSDILDVIKLKLSVILRACKHARRRNHYAQKYQVLEIETRHDWDILLTEFMRSESLIVFPFLESSLNMPRNQAADNHHAEFDEYYSTYGDYAHEETQRCRRYARHAQQALVRKTAPVPYLQAAKQEAARRSAQADAVVGQLLQVQIMWTRITESAVHEHVTKDPLTGKCDAIATLFIPDFFSNHEPARQDFILFNRAFAKSSSSQKLTETTGRDVSPNSKGSGSVSWALLGIPTGGNPDSSLNRDSDSSVRSDIFGSTRNEAVFSQGPRDITEVTTPSSQASLFGQARPPVRQKGTSGIDIPLFVTKYNSLHRDFIVTGVNQGQLCGAACAQFLASLGITSFPVFGLVTEGSWGVATCTYAGPRGKTLTVRQLKKSTDTDKNYTRVLEANGQQFDITTPLGAFHYAIFLCNLASRHAREMQERLASVKEDYLRKRDNNDPSLRWTLEAQLEELGNLTSTES